MNKAKKSLANKVSKSFVKDPRILVADDEAVIRDLFKRILETKGHQVVTVGSGTEAIDEIKTESFDIIFLDIVMPGVSGLKACQTIEKINPEAKIVMMTGYGAEVEEEIARSLKAGAYECLYKPFTIKALLDTLEKVLKK